MNATVPAYWVEVLAARFPEFVRSNTFWQPDLGYHSFGSFAIFICTRIRAAGADDVVLRAFDLINEMAEVKSDAIDDLIGAGFLEILGDHDACREAAEKHLSPRAKEIIEEGVLGWPR